MFTSYNEALDWIHARLRLGIKPGLKRMEVLMAQLGSPEKKLQAIHVGGTNGKGSTVTYLRSMLQKSGYIVGTFTSPYIEQFNERISVNGQAINDQELLKLVNKIRPLAEQLEETELGGPTEFEVITAMAFYYFAEMRPVDFVLFEVGLGGRFDSTNIIQPLASVITNIGFDHTAILGNSCAEIAFEKAGIIKRETPVFTAVQQPEAFAVIEKQAQEKQANIHRLHQEFSVTAHRSESRGEVFTFIGENKTLKDLKITMIGKHQTENAALAIATLHYLNKQGLLSINDDEIRRGLRDAYWPGRFEILAEDPLVIIDGAHNDEGVEKLVATLAARYHDRTIHIVFAALKDKQLDKMIAQLDEVADKLSFVSFDFPRAAAAEDLLQLSSSQQKQAAEDWQIYLHEELEKLNEKDVLVVTGSLYFISTVRPYLVEKLKLTTQTI